MKLLYSYIASMTLYDKYINGRTEQVYREITALGKRAFLPAQFPEIEKIMKETFQRVSHNLNIIYSELKKINYLFKTTFEYNFQRPLMKPLSNTEQLLTKLDKTVNPFGFVPLSLKMFYRIVGACNFGWDYDTNENYIWQFADPIQIVSLNDLVEELTDQEYLSDLNEDYKEDGFIALSLSHDYWTKDNTSGGPSYSLRLTETPAVDGQFLNEEHTTTFINYLRICFDNCGFPRITNPAYGNDYKGFFDIVKPQLKLI